MILAYNVLTSSVLSCGLRAELFSPSLQASRQAALALGVKDTLSTTVELLKAMMEKVFGISEAAPVFARLAEGLDDADRTAALQVFLRPPRP
jgi:hypothetical protein